MFLHLSCIESGVEWEDLSLGSYKICTDRLNLQKQAFLRFVLQLQQVVFNDLGAVTN